MVEQDYIYFLHDRQSNAIKIGTSKDPKKRCQLLQVASPSQLIHIRSVPVEDGPGVEHLLHVQFAGLRIRGEWFKVTDDLLAFAESGQLPEPDPEQVKQRKNRPRKPQGRLSLLELEEKAEVSARTLRYYISQGVLHGPWERGSKAYYDQSHVEQVEEIKKKKLSGMTLAEIARDSCSEVVVQTPPEILERYVVAEGVEVVVRGQVAAQRRNTIRRALAKLEQELTKTDEQEKDDE